MQTDKNQKAGVDTTKTNTVDTPKQPKAPETSPAEGLRTQKPPPPKAEKEGIQPTAPTPPQPPPPSAPKALPPAPKAVQGKPGSAKSAKSDPVSSLMHFAMTATTQAVGPNVGAHYGAAARVAAYPAIVRAMAKPSPATIAKPGSANARGRADVVMATAIPANHTVMHGHVVSPSGPAAKQLPLPVVSVPSLPVQPPPPHLPTAPSLSKASGAGTPGSSSSSSKNKRKRVKGGACAHCHARKLRCEEKKPCFRCVKHKILCVPRNIVRSGSRKRAKSNATTIDVKSSGVDTAAQYSTPVSDGQGAARGGIAVKRLSDKLNPNRGVRCYRNPYCIRPNFHPGHCKVETTYMIPVQPGTGAGNSNPNFQSRTTTKINKLPTQYKFKPAPQNTATVTATATVVAGIVAPQPQPQPQAAAGLVARTPVQPLKALQVKPKQPKNNNKKAGGGSENVMGNNNINVRATAMHTLPQRPGGIIAAANFVASPVPKVAPASVIASVRGVAPVPLPLPMPGAPPAAAAAAAAAQQTPTQTKQTTADSKACNNNDKNKNKKAAGSVAPAAAVVNA